MTIGEAGSAPGTPRLSGVEDSDPSSRRPALDPGDSPQGARQDQETTECCRACRTQDGSGCCCIHEADRHADAAKDGGVKVPVCESCKADGHATPGACCGYVFDGAEELETRSVRREPFGYCVVDVLHGVACPKDDSGNETTIFGTREEAERHKVEGEVVMGLFFLGKEAV